MMFTMHPSPCKTDLGICCRIRNLLDSSTTQCFPVPMSRAVPPQQLQADSSDHFDFLAFVCGCSKTRWDARYQPTPHLPAFMQSSGRSCEVQIGPGFTGLSGIKEPSAVAASSSLTERIVYDWNSALSQERHHPE